MRNIFLLITFSSIICLAAEGIQTEDLGSTKREHGVKAKTPEKGATIDYSKLKGAEEEQPAGKIARGKVVKSKDNVAAKAPFYKVLGKITIRASEEYVYIRAGKSAVIMDSEGKILIDASGDLIISGNRDIILNAKNDIVSRPGGKIVIPESRDGENRISTE